MPKPDISEDRKNQILDASIKVFAKHGFQKARMDDIAKQARLAKGTLYLYFKNKDEIINHALTSIIEGELTHIQSLHQTDLSTKEKLQQVIVSAIKDFKKFEPIYPLFYEFYAYALRSKSIRKFFTGYFKTYLKALIPIFEEGIARGELKDIDPENAAISVSAVIEGTLVLLIYDPDRIDLEKHMRFSAEMLLEGLLK